MQYRAISITSEDEVENLETWYEKYIAQKQLMVIGNHLRYSNHVEYIDMLKKLEKNKDCLDSIKRYSHKH